MPKGPAIDQGTTTKEKETGTIRTGNEIDQGTESGNATTTTDIVMINEEKHETTEETTADALVHETADRLRPHEDLHLQKLLKLHLQKTKNSERKGQN